MTRALPWLFSLILPLLLVQGAPSALAHETTRSYVTIARDGPDVTANVRVALRDIEVAVWMDENLDGALTWGEVERRLDPVSAYILAGLTLDAGGACVLRRSAAGTSRDASIDYLDLSFRGICPDADAPLVATSRLFAEIDPDHRVFLSAQTGGLVTTSLLSRTNPQATLAGDTGGLAASFGRYFVSGIEHLFGGPDHLVFLMVLILPAVCMRGNLRAATIGVIAAVTGFTLAHATTVTAAMTELLRPPPLLIESLIALSIMITAVDNVRPFIPAPRAASAAFFGIFHGFGFASALGALQLTGAGFATALVGFNLGIEVAQVALVLAVMPVMYVLGAGRAVLWAGSAIAFAAGTWWLWQRLSPVLLAA